MPFNRSDITQTIVHFVSADSNAAALETLWRIISEQRLRGSDLMIKGGFKCVCFTEAPIEHVREILLIAEAVSHRYKPFGVAVEKSWLYQCGGRPVIYQSDEEYSLLPDGLRWRHVRYEPNGQPPIDFTWEREWRLHAGHLPIDPQNCTVIVPDKEAEAELVNRHDHEEHVESLYRAEEQPLEFYPGSDVEPFPWRVHRLTG